MAAARGCETGAVGTIYLLHFGAPIAHARHYVGWCRRGEAERRLAEHRRGCGSPLVRAAISAGIDVELAATWDGTRDDERRFKRRSSTPRHCPKCHTASNRPLPAGASALA